MNLKVNLCNNKVSHIPDRVHSNLLWCQLWNRKQLCNFLCWCAIVHFYNEHTTMKNILTHQVQYSVWIDQLQTWTCNRPAHQGTNQRKITCSITKILYIKDAVGNFSCIILTDLCPLTLDTLTIEPLVLIRWGTQSWVRWYIDLQYETKVNREHVFLPNTVNLPSSSDISLLLFFTLSSNVSPWSYDVTWHWCSWPCHIEPDLLSQCCPLPGYQRC